MKNHRKFFQAGISFLIISLSSINLYSCKNILDISPKGSLSEEILANETGVKALLTGAYAALDGAKGNTTSLAGSAKSWGASPSYYLFGSIAGGDAHKGADGGSEVAMDPIERWTVTPVNPYVLLMWDYLYEGVSRANAVLQLLPKVKDISDDERANIEAQARFLRGHFYFGLKKMFNMVPWIDENTKNFKQPNNEDIWPKIEADFKFAMDNLPNTQSQIGRVNKWAAASYLAKTYVFEKKWEKAEPLLDNIMANGITSNRLSYKLTEKFEDNFKAGTENNSASVFAVQMVANDGTNTIGNANSGDLLNYPYGGPFRCCGIFQPTQDLVNSFRTNPDTGLPYLDDYNKHPIKSDMGLSSSDPFKPDPGTLDPRLDWTVGRRGIPYLDWGLFAGKDWIRDQSYAGPYAPSKNVFWQKNDGKYNDKHSWAPGTAINLSIIRYDEVVLWAAETKAQLGKLDQAEKLVNKIRNRAANKDGWVHKYIDPDHPMKGFTNQPAANYFIKLYPKNTFESKGKAYALKVIYFESKLELAMEGRRFFNLSRWGIAAETINKYYTYESKITPQSLINAHFTKGTNEFYPIPQTEIDRSSINGKPTLVQNTGYK